MKIRYLLLLSLFLFVIYAAAASAQAVRSSISGFVFDQNRRPIAQVPVELMNEVNSIVQRTRTDGSGRYYFMGAQHGRYTIRVLPLGTDLETGTVEIEVTGTNARGTPVSDHIQQDIHLRPRKSRAPAGVTGTVFAQEVPKNAEALYKRAVDDLADEQNAEAIKNFEAALQAFPTYYAALERLGLLYLQKEEFEKAKEFLERATAINPRSFYGWHGLSVAEYSLKHPTEAIAAAKKSTEISPDAAEAFLVMGLSHRLAKEYEYAETSLKRAEKLSGGASAEVHWQLALLYAHNLKKYGDAADQLERYLKVNPDVPNADMVKKLIRQFRSKTPGQ